MKKRRRTGKRIVAGGVQLAGKQFQPYDGVDDDDEDDEQGNVQQRHHGPQDRVEDHLEAFCRKNEVKGSLKVKMTDGRTDGF